MVSRVFSAGLEGIDGYIVTAECFLSSGLPRFDLVGLPTGAVSEAAERVRAALKQSGYDWPVSRITVNLAPADTKKAGTAYDLPILLGILAADGSINMPSKHAVFLGELSLSGDLRPINGALSMALAAQQAGFHEIFVPAENAAEASYAGAITVYPVVNVGELLSHLRGAHNISPQSSVIPQHTAPSTLDFKHVMGQRNAKRALEVAAAGGHNVLLCGPPGSGKSMLSKRFPSILPPLTKQERLDVIRIYSSVGRVNEVLESGARPYRAPHHTTSANAIAGGSGVAGKLPTPGEITLAHHGVLFLDEFPEFRRDVLEVLRQPLEDGKVTISRVAGQMTYPAQFQLIAAMNPCKCGWYGTNRCSCSATSVQAYLKRLSGPLLDRIDLQVFVQPVPYDALSARANDTEDASDIIRQRVLAALALQHARQSGIRNADIAPSSIASLCVLSPDASDIFAAAFTTLGLTARAHDRILRVARTIADLDGADSIDASHIAEALQYRSLDRELS